MKLSQNKLIITIVYVFCGMLCALPAIYNDLWFLAWVAYIPVLINEYTRKPDGQKPYLKAWGRGLCFFFPFGVTTFSWIVGMYPMDFVGFDPSTAFLVILLAIIGIPLLQSIFTSFNIVCLCFLKRNRVSAWAYPLAAASMWIIQEWLQTLTWAGIPWGKLAIGQVGILQNIQSISLFGPYFTSFLIITCAGYIALFFVNIGNEKYKQRAIAMGCVAIVLFGLNFTYGSVRMHIRDESKTNFIAAAIQGNITPGEKWEESPAIVDKHVELVRNASEDGAELIVLAETALPFDFNSAEVRSFVDATRAETDAEIILGCFTSSSNKSYNSTVMYSNADSVADTIYHKQKLVPFGEFLPMHDVMTTFLPFLANINQFSSEVTPGNSSNLLTSRHGKIGSLICFDSIYETIALQSVQDGAEILAISTNDSWFGDSAAAQQHNSMAILRAIELDRYVIRSGNTGVSSIITNRGEVQQCLATSEQGYVIGEVKTYDTRTLYSNIGNAIVIFAFALLLLVSTASYLKTRRIEGRADRVKAIERSEKEKYSDFNKRTKK